MKNKSTYVVALAVALGICVVAVPVTNAQLSASGPFVGTLQEHFEGFVDYIHTSPPNLFQPSPATVFGGAATLSANNLFVFNPSAGSNFRLYSSGSDAMPTDGKQGMGVASTGDPSTFTFSNPIYSFGGYFGARTGRNPDGNQVFADPAPISMSFFDVFNNQIGATQTWNYSRTGFADGLLEWHGYISTVGAKKVVVSSTNTLYAYDNLQAASVPEPGLMASLIGAGTIGGLMALRRRRKA